MSTQTNKLGLFKYDPIVDKEELFDIQEALNDNWDKIDNSIKNADWNQNDESAPDFVKNKPVVFEPSDTLTWDGNTEGLEVVMDSYLVSSATPSIADFVNGAELIVDGSSITVPSSEVEELVSGYIVVGEWAVIATTDNLVLTESITIRSKGVYLSPNISSLTIPGYTGFGQEKIAPSHLYQPDWNQNDESAPDFVKNRPFYIAKEIIASDVSVETNEGNDSVYHGDLTAEVTFTSGEQYEVVFEGASYVLAAINLNDIVFLGNAALYFAIANRYTVEEATNEVLPSLGLPVNNVPFCIVDENGNYRFYTTSTVSPAIFSVYGENVAKINEKFLPDTIATKADIEAAIGAAIGGSY